MSSLVCLQLVVLFLGLHVHVPTSTPIYRYFVNGLEYINTVRVPIRAAAYQSPKFLIVTGYRTMTNVAHSELVSGYEKKVIIIPRTLTLP